jgi:hypothetical protein
MGSKHEGQIDQWQRGSVTPPEHNLRRSKGITSRREARLEDPLVSHQEPSGREMRRAEKRTRRTAEDAGPGEGAD